MQYIAVTQQVDFSFSSLLLSTTTKGQKGDNMRLALYCVQRKQTNTSDQKHFHNLAAGQLDSQETYFWLCIDLWNGWILLLLHAAVDLMNL
jgi:hypothetical protein